ncbi:N-terminal nucleophile aminohydrolases (Ntn hydrolases) superfamily protein [Actinidia rufa]|uniref:N-terminal nucleophile aminohydrolases (Ntn hydrolases) superfamily protein n=1 Tax=Actinidia rufa TaxID=165716 RepID=A0A7J0G7J6_9ERIC|nr:N-terminal nucleophile aminohydrolases (Ntn hydrolases) superfamily protein [Actinidia rufa]
MPLLQFFPLLFTQIVTTTGSLNAAGFFSQTHPLCRYPSTNAGRGSNLTEDGHVECDASVMDGDSGAFGAVGAVPGVRNGIQLAALLAKEQMLGTSLLGRIPPMCTLWAKSKGIPLPASIEEADKSGQNDNGKKYKAMLDEAKAMTAHSHIELSSGPRENAAISGSEICPLSMLMYSPVIHVYNDQKFLAPPGLAKGRAA